ncbi:hypothetical protein [Cryptosporangium minutisporangium]
MGTHSRPRYLSDVASCNAHGRRRVEPYSARSTRQTYLARVAKIDDVVLTVRAGHSDVAVTKRHYIKVGINDLAEATRAMSAYFD